MQPDLALVSKLVFKGKTVRSFYVDAGATMAVLEGPDGELYDLELKRRPPAPPKAEEPAPPPEKKLAVNHQPAPAPSPAPREEARPLMRAPRPLEQRCRAIVESLRRSERLPKELRDGLAELERAQWTDEDARELAAAAVKAQMGDRAALVKLLLRKREKILRLVR